MIHLRRRVVAKDYGKQCRQKQFLLGTSQHEGTSSLPQFVCDPHSKAANPSFLTIGGSIVTSPAIALKRKRWNQHIVARHCHSCARSFFAHILHPTGQVRAADTWCTDDCHPACCIWIFKIVYLLTLFVQKSPRKHWELRVPDADTRIGFRHMQGSLSGDCSGQTVPLPKWEAFEHTAVLEVWQRGQRRWYVKTLQIYRSHMVPVKTQWRWQDLSRFDELDQPDLAKSFRGDLFTGRGGTLDLCRVSKDICTWRDIDGKEIVAQDFSLMTQLVWWDGHDTAHCVCIWDQMKNMVRASAEFSLPDMACRLVC